MPDNNGSVITEPVLSIPTDITFITRKCYVAVHRLRMCIIETLKWSLYEYVWFITNSACPTLTLLLIKLSNRKLMIIATAYFVEVLFYPHIKLELVEMSQGLHVCIVHPCLIEQRFCCPAWLFLTCSAGFSMKIEHEIELTHYFFLSLPTCKQ